MMGLVLAGLCAVGAWAGTFYGLDWGWGWSVFLGVVGFGVFQFASGMVFRKRLQADMERVQNILVNGQKQLQAKVARWQFRPPGSMAEAQRQIAADTRVFVLEALKETEALAKYRLWVPLVMRQMATAQLQLRWMIKDFAEVDRLMPRAIFVDPTTSAMKMARMYMLKEPSDAIEKVYLKAAGRTRYNGNVLLAATWSWILLQRGETDRAFKALTEALKKSDDATLKKNHEVLMNNRPGQFTNAGLGDPWYALHLEEPKMNQPRQRPVYR